MQAVPDATRALPEPRLLPRLTAFRWYAALAVFLFHLDAAMRWKPIRVFTFGWTGVSFFYVLSGFVLVWSLGGDSSRRRFYQRRFARIYPATLATGVVAAVLAANHALSVRGGMLGAITSLLFVQAWFPGTYPVYSYNSVTWSLSCEAFFYVLLPFLAAAIVWRSRSIVAAAAACLAAGLAVTVTLAALNDGSRYAYTSPLIRLPEFVLGVALALLVRKGWRPPVRLWQACAVLLVTILVVHRFFLQQASFPLADYVFLPAVTLLLLAGTRADLLRRTGLLTSRLSVYLGEVSFCFYLVHFLVIQAVVREGGWTHERFGLVAGAGPAVLAFALTLGAAVVLHHVVELPLQYRLRPSRSPVPASDSTHVLSPRSVAPPSRE